MASAPARSPVVGLIDGAAAPPLPGGVEMREGIDAALSAADVRRADVVLVWPGTTLPDGWLDSLRAAAEEDTQVATVAPVVAGAARMVQGGVRARVLTAGPPVLYVRRAALELCGPWDDDLPRRCLEAGLVHVLAGDVVAAGSPHTPEPSERLSAVARALRVARVSGRRLGVTIDARCLTGRMTGTEVHTLQLIRALARAGEVDLRVLAPEGADIPEGVERIAYQDVVERPARTDVVHRPYQVTSADDLGVLILAGERAVVTHQDLIAYRNPAYHPTAGAWEEHRRHTRSALGLADIVVFESDHAQFDAIVDDLVPAHRARVVAIGVDHRADGVRPTRPDGVADAPFLLCLGTDYRHKNRLFAMRLTESLRERGWDGGLIVAGPHVEHGGSAEDETAWRAEHPSVPVLDLGPVSEAEKAWLYGNAAAVAYPTIYEGFGLIPFEAAAHGTPCAWAPVSSLADVLPADLALIVPWDADASADRLLPVIRDPSAHLTAVREAGERYTWDRTAAELRGVYEEAVRLPGRVAAVAAEDALQAELARAGWEDRFWDLRRDIGPTGLSLVGPEAEGRLLPEDAQRTLAALARRRVTRAPLLAALQAAQRVKRS